MNAKTNTILFGLFLLASSCTQVSEDPEPTDAGEDAQDVGQTNGADVSDDISGDSDGDLDASLDADASDSERYCDPEYAQPRVEQGIAPEEETSCSCLGRSYLIDTDDCGKLTMICGSIGWSKQSCAPQDADID